jgi:hypothetical protein
MPKPVHYPRTLTDWLKQLDGQLLPASSSSQEKLRRALADSNRSMRELTELMQDCPALALSVLREANRKSSGLGEQTESLEAAINRLGIQRTESLLNRLPALPEQDLPKALRQIQLISQHASQQANGLFASRLARLWQEVHWGSLLFLAPIWTLLAAHPELFDAWEQRVLVKGEAASKVEQELLGVPLLKLCLALSEQWHLPEWITQSYSLLVNDRRLLVKALHIARDNEHPLHQQQSLDADSNLRRWLTHPANSILLANGLALSAHYAWNSPHSLRWQRLTGLFLQLRPPDARNRPLAPGRSATLAMAGAAPASRSRATQGRRRQRVASALRATARPTQCVCQCAATHCQRQSGAPGLRHATRADPAGRPQPYPFTGTATERPGQGRREPQPRAAT